MPEPSLLPPIFRELIDAADNLEKLTPEAWESFYSAIGEDENLLPELVCVLGPNTFETLIRYFGGQTLKLPKPGDILRKGKEHDDSSDE